MSPIRKILWLVVIAAGIALLGVAGYYVAIAYTRDAEKMPDGYRSAAAFKTMIPFLVILTGIAVVEIRGFSTGWVVPGMIGAIGAFATLGAGLFVSLSGKVQTMAIPGAGLFFLALAAGAALFFVVEFLLLRLFSLGRLGAIVRVTYYEALLQPFTLIVLGLGVACVAIFAFFPFFTQNEEAKMFRDVGMSFSFIFTLPVMIFASSKVIDEEIENRTMLILMSKPVARWQVVIGKYLGVVIVSMVVMTILGIAVGASAYVRYFEDMRMDYLTTPAEGVAELNLQNTRAIMALAPSLILKFLQIATLAAVAVAISTRYGLAFNITAIALLFVLANLTQFVDTLGLARPWQDIVVWLSSLLPHLNLFDIDQRLIYGQYATAAQLESANIGGPDAQQQAQYLRELPTLTQIWQYVGMATVYGVLYIGAALSAAVALFRTRELT